MSSVSWRVAAAFCKLLWKGLTVTADGANYIIDALEVHDLMYKLRDIFADPSIVKVAFQDRTSATGIWRQSETIVPSFCQIASLIWLEACVSERLLLQVLHGGENDIIWLQRDFQIYIANLFDTERSCCCMPQGFFKYLPANLSFASQ